MPPLLSYHDVRDLLPKHDVQDAQLEAAMRLVAGWLRNASGLTELPAPLLPDHDLYAPAVELVKLEVVNPEQVQSRGFGPKTQTFSTFSVKPRRDAILAEVRARYEAAAAAPRGSFPKPMPWPDPTRLSQTSEGWIYS